MASSARIDELRKKFEENPRRYFAPLANEYRKAGDVDQAIAICREYLPQQPGHMSGHIVYGQALYEGREFEEAKGVFETALSLDPENLIALRHLGDIALILGDTEGAKSWYGRVLEADPRNEEIQAQLKSLDAVTPPNATTAETPATQAAVPEPAASSAPTVVVSALKAPEIVRTVEQPAMSVPPEKPVNQVETLGSAPTAEITLDNVPSPDIPALENLESLSLPDSPAPVGEAAAGFEPTAASGEPAAPGDRLALDTAVPGGSGTVPAIDSFTLEGLETTSMTPESASGLSSAPESESALSLTPESEPLPLSTPEPMSMWEGTAETLPGRSELTIEESQEMVVNLGTPESVQAQKPQSDSPAGIDALDLGLPASAPASPREGSVAASPTAEGSGPASPTADLPMIDVSDSAEASAQVQDQSPEAAREPGPFVTETMAELYLSQGHREEALRVYRALVEQRPDDAALRAKLDRMQADAGPTIRELLAR
ncbi:MAG TPA: tetratricopeptide repeat protein, partial [Gemmatimonadaceae bacterium]|nr:tetratricopeptide repeat protein [Gemmatimonadaceae bacterium]